MTQTTSRARSRALVFWKTVGVKEEGPGAVPEEQGEDGENWGGTDLKSPGEDEAQGRDVAPS